MKFFRVSGLLLLLLRCAPLAFAQAPATIGQTVLVVPFENQSKAPGIEWIGDSFPELLQERLNSPTLFVLPREDRIRAYDRLGIPVNLRPSRATIYRIAEQLDVDYVILGAYNFDGQDFTIRAQLLDMRRERLLPEMPESGRLTELIDLQTALSWDVLHTLNPGLTVSRDAYRARVPAVRLDAFENYVKGVVAPQAEEQVRHLREALRINPAYSDALLQLGKTYYNQRDYEQADACLSRVPQDDPKAGEANFYLGLAAYSRGDFQLAESAFKFVAARLPLSEIYNNLGVVVDHRDLKSAVQYFQKAVDADPNDPDYHFNLGVELYRMGNLAEAARQMRETVSLRPDDNDAKSVLEMLPGGIGPRQRGVVPASSKLPTVRVRSSYDESSFRQLALKLDAAAEVRLAKTDPSAHAQFHSDRGHQLLSQGFVSEAEREFRETVALNPASAEAHAGLADALEASGKLPEARAEAEEALRLRQFAEPLLVLARLDLRDNRVEAAADEIDRALRLEPNNVAAQELKRSVAAKLAQEAQPLPNR
ncbi:MAG: tetratricopeptide repeat protein [Terriglobales bacterium]